MIRHYRTSERAVRGAQALTDDVEDVDEGCRVGALEVLENQLAPLLLLQCRWIANLLPACNPTHPWSNHWRYGSKRGTRSREGEISAMCSSPSATGGVAYPLPRLLWRAAWCFVPASRLHAAGCRDTSLVATVFVVVILKQLPVCQSNGATKRGTHDKGKTHAGEVVQSVLRAMSEYGMGSSFW